MRALFDERGCLHVVPDNNAEALALSYWADSGTAMEVHTEDRFDRDGELVRVMGGFVT